MQNVLVTGANGFVGQYLSESLLENYRVVATSKGPSRFDIQHHQYSYHPLDFSIHQEVKEVVSKYKPSVIVHSGALSKPDECECNRGLAYRINVEATGNLLEEAAMQKSFFVFLSTDFIFSGEEGMYQENDAPAPVNYYGQTKLLAEAEVKAYPYDWCIVRTVLVYGNPKTGRQNIPTNVASALKQDRELNIYDDQVRTPTYVEDLACGIKTIIDKKATGVFHISGDDMLTPYQMACAVADHLHLNKKLINPVTEQTFHQTARRPLKTGFNLTKAKRELNYKPTPFQEGLRKTFNGFL